MSSCHQPVDSTMISQTGQSVGQPALGSERQRRRRHSLPAYFAVYPQTFQDPPDEPRSYEAHCHDSWIPWVITRARQRRHPLQGGGWKYMGGGIYRRKFQPEWFLYPEDTIHEKTKQKKELMNDWKNLDQGMPRSSWSVLLSKLPDWTALPSLLPDLSVSPSWGGWLDYVEYPMGVVWDAIMRDFRWRRIVRYETVKRV